MLSEYAPGPRVGSAFSVNILTPFGGMTIGRSVATMQVQERLTPKIVNGSADQLLSLNDTLGTLSLETIPKDLAYASGMSREPRK
jgi:hypothetical protein